MDEESVRRIHQAINVADIRVRDFTVAEGSPKFICMKRKTTLASTSDGPNSSDENAQGTSLRVPEDSVIPSDSKRPHLGNLDGGIDGNQDDEMPALCSGLSEVDMTEITRDGEAETNVRQPEVGVEMVGMPALEDDEEESGEDEMPDLLSEDDDDDDDDHMDDHSDEENMNDPIFNRVDEHEPEILIDDFSHPAPQYSLPALHMWKDFQNIKSHRILQQRLVGSLELVRRMGKFAELKHHRGCVNSLNFSPSGQLLASGSDDLKVGIWDWAKKKLVTDFPSGHFANVFQSKFMPLSNDSLIATASRDGAVRLAEISQAGGSVSTKALCKHRGSCHKIDVRPDSYHGIMSCGEDAAVNYMDIRQPKPNKCLIVADDHVKIDLYSIMTNPLKSTEFLVTGSDKYVRVFDMRFLKSGNLRAPPVLKLCPTILQESSLSFHVSSGVYNHTGSEILASYNDYNIFLMQNATPGEDGAKAIQEYEGHRNHQTIKGVNFYGSGSEYVVSGSDCGRVFFWDRITGQIVHYVLADDDGAVNVLEPHPSHPFLATSGLAHTIKVWAPNAEEPSDLDDLIEVIEEHQSDRKRNLGHQRNGPDRDGRFIMMLMEHLQRRERRERGNRAPGVAPPAAPPVGDLDEMPPLEESDDDEDEDADVMPGDVNCNTS